jgi:hypothetical protein
MKAGSFSQQSVILQAPLVKGMGMSAFTESIGGKRTNCWRNRVVLPFNKAPRTPRHIPSTVAHLDFSVDAGAGLGGAANS